MSIVQINHLSNVVMQVTSFSKLNSKYDVGEAKEQPDLCYHQCTKCAIIFQCRKITLYTVSFERCTNHSSMVNVIFVINDVT